MAKAVLILTLISMAALVYSITILGSRIDKKEFMHVEICDNKSCSRCLDKEQCRGR